MGLNRISIIYSTVLITIACARLAAELVFE